MQRKFPTRTSLRQAATGIASVIKLPRYICLSIGLSLFFICLMYFLINFSFYSSLIASIRSISLLFELIWHLFTTALVYCTTSIPGALLLAVSILQGLSLAAVIFIARRNAKNSQLLARQVGVSSFASIAAAIGLGCVPCGTSLILPIITLFFSGTSAVTAASVAGVVVLVAALILSVISLYSSGKIAYKYHIAQGES